MTKRCKECEHHKRFDTGDLYPDKHKCMKYDFELGQVLIEYKICPIKNGETTYKGCKRN